MIQQSVQSSHPIPSFHPNNCPPSMFSTLLFKDHGVNIVDHHDVDQRFITRKKSFYLLATLLVIGIAVSLSFYAYSKATSVH